MSIGKSLVWALFLLVIFALALPFGVWAALLIAAAFACVLMLLTRWSPRGALEEEEPSGAE